MSEIAVLHYRTVEGRFPYRDWVASIADKKARAAVLARVDRLAFGTFGDWKVAGDGVFELRVHLGPGYRVYFGRKGKAVVILLCGGDKRSQISDIKQARRYWNDYETRTKEATSGRSAR
jgi:putative addiction module killer protein